MSNIAKPQWDEFILWMLKPESARGAIATEVAWAEAHGVTTRTLRRWKSMPGFEARLAELNEVAQVNKSLVAEAGTGVPVSGDEGDYQVVKAALVDGAKSGNPKYLELYFKTYGKPFVEEEAASRTSDLTGMDLEDLISQALVSIGPELVAERLRGLGWLCEAP
jgi:hypothetical protein